MKKKHTDFAHHHHCFGGFCDSINVAEIQDTIKHYFRYEIIITTNRLISL
ncbi:MAG: hypothetical protein J6Y11_13190 [Paludibacteraceae bacterium]|nr:hypothetical protein [Paludibacteraceae bacterium]